MLAKQTLFQLIPELNNILWVPQHNWTQDDIFKFSWVQAGNMNYLTTENSLFYKQNIITGGKLLISELEQYRVLLHECGV